MTLIIYLFVYITTLQLDFYPNHYPLRRFHIEAQLFRLLPPLPILRKTGTELPSPLLS